MPDVFTVHLRLSLEKLMALPQDLKAFPCRLIIHVVKVAELCYTYKKIFSFNTIYRNNIQDCLSVFNCQDIFVVVYKKKWTFLLVKKFDVNDLDFQVHTEIRDVTCHMRSYSATCHPTQLNAPRLTPARKAGTRFTHPRGIEGWVYLGGWVHTKMVYLSAVAHPSSNPRSTQPSIPPGSLNRVPAYWLGLRRGAFTCVGWQVTLCDPIWQVTSRSCEMGVPLTAIHCFTFFYL